MTQIAYETPYVVMFQQVNLLSGDAKRNEWKVWRENPGMLGVRTS